MQFAPTLSSISTFDNCGAFGAKATIQRTDDSIWWARRILRSPGPTIPLGGLVQAAANWKAISRLLTSLRHSKAGPATWLQAWKELGCFWNGSGVRGCWVFCCQAGMSQPLTLCSCRLSSAYYCLCDRETLQLLTDVNGTIHYFVPHTHIYKRVKLMTIAQFRQEINMGTGIKERYIFIRKLFVLILNEQTSFEYLANKVFGTVISLW